MEGDVKEGEVSGGVSRGGAVVATGWALDLDGCAGDDGSSTEPERLPALPCPTAEAAQRPSEREKRIAIEVRTIDQPLAVRACEPRSKTLRQERQSIPEDAASSCARYHAGYGTGRRWPAEEVKCTWCSKRMQQVQAGNRLTLESECGAEFGFSDQCCVRGRTERTFIKGRREGGLFSRKMQHGAVCMTGLSRTCDQQKGDAQKDDTPEPRRHERAVGSAGLERAHHVFDGFP